MDKIYDNCCGIDVHKKIIVACRKIGNEQEIREFGATTSSLLNLADWLCDGNCQKIAMESTASYWKPLYNVFEASGLDVMIVNAAHMKAVPGRKTDVKDAEWIADLLQHGLLTPSFIPNREQRELREIVQYRQSLVQERSRELNRLQKMLEGANIKLSGDIKDIMGMSGRNILETILEGATIDSDMYDELYQKGKISHNLHATKEQIIDDCNGILSTSQIHMMKIVIAHIDELSKHIENLNAEIDSKMNQEEKEACEAIQDIPGIGETSAEAIIAAIGTDMSRFPTDANLCSWAGLCPGNNESAKKRRSGRTRPGNQLLKNTLVVCAHSAVKCKDSYFRAQYLRICAHRGSKRAYVAVAHSMLIAIYHILKDHVPFKDLGIDYYNQYNTERKIKEYIKKLEKLGWVPESPTKQDSEKPDDPCEVA